MQTPTLPSIPSLQVDEALKRLGGSAKLYMKALRMFYDSLPQYLTDITEQFNAGDKESITRTFHTLKGLSGTIGAEELAAESARIESIAKESMPSANEVQAYQSLLQEFKQALDTVNFG